MKNIYHSISRKIYNKAFDKIKKRMSLTPEAYILREEKFNVHNSRVILLSLKNGVKGKTD